MKAIKLLLLIGILSFLAPTANASHYMGGEITWECKSNGKFVFTLKYYRECGGITFGNSITLSSNSPAGSINMTLASGWPKDITPQCNNNPNYTHITCSNVTASNLGAVEEYIYHSQEIQIVGVPPATGWVFYHSSCCRNPSTNVTGQPGWALRAIMYTYNNQNTYPCFDNSPTFAEKARSVIDVGYPTTYNHLPFDVEGDSLSYAWGQPWVSNNSPLNTYAGGYSFMNPLPGTAQNPNNVPAFLDPQTGQISYTSYTSGAFVTSVKATSYRNGIKIAEIWRDIQMVLRASNSVNLPPLLSPHFNSSSSYYLQTDTFFVGQHVSLNFQSLDNGLHPDGTNQTITLTTWGSNFGSFVPPSGNNQATHDPNSGCNIPPCATMTPAPGPGYPVTGLISVGSQFEWQTECVHLANNNIAGTNMSEYNFYFKVTDDYCPFPYYAQYQYRIILKPTQQTNEFTDIECTQVMDGGDVKLFWNPVADTLGLLQSYQIFAASNPQGPYAQVGHIPNPRSNSFIHYGAGADQQAIYYYIESLSGCTNFDTDTARSDTISTLFMELNPSTSVADLDWHSDYSIREPSNGNQYHIYTKDYQNNMQYYQSTMQDSLSDTVKTCQSTHAYKVEIMNYGLKDSLGNVFSAPSISNFTQLYTYKDLSAPQPVTLTMVTIDPVSAEAKLFWINSMSPDVEGYFVYKFIQNNWQLYDTIFGVLHTAYTDVNNNPYNPPLTSHYKVASFDYCANISPLSNHYTGVAISDVNEKEHRIFPNPTTGEVYFELIEIEKLELYNNQGQRLETIEGNIQKFDLSKYSSGVYYFRITTKGKSITKKIILE